MKKVLITGGAGFIAHHLIYFLLKNTNWEIISLDRLDYSGNLNRLDHIVSEIPESERKRLKIVFHDLKSEINPWIKKEIGNVDIILHLAAGSHVDRSIDYPMEFVLDNVIGTANILDFARFINDKQKLERFIYFSTDEVFGPAPKGVDYAENDRYNSTNPYSATKAAGEELSVAYENTYGLPVYITHTMNVFGERQHPEKFIPMCIKKIRDGESVTIHSDRTKTIPGTRHYIHANDVAKAIYFLLLKKINIEFDYGGAKCPKFNIVGPEEINNLELAQIIADSQGKDLKYQMVDFHSSRPGHDLRYSLSGDKMKKLGWEPSIKLTNRIKQVVEWSLKNQSWIEI
ncbi:MAG: NAD-dependent epimerase/dehydratase family protein [Pelagibacteraceae bacterium]|jgi:dTDP-glucose 4,6-dehydratase|nr:NAD-dependent epimerase/dehydratase family protein [Pelagibacteraceae bacterium]MBT6170901.1 NAD-dependent epimerase/dehydratase family protein [Flavobacteriaceae bacterium]MBT6448086.1 NAD-dependent epimerase/dehydratase family protein [Flavobacteriaceae bacterium]